MRPQKLHQGDTVAVIAPSLSFASISQEVRDIAARRFDELGLKVIFGKHIEETDDFGTSSVASRLTDLHDAFANSDVKAVFAVRGGWSANQLLPFIDWELIKANPKIFCGFSNITMLSTAINAKTGLLTYYGAGYSSFGQELYFDYTLDYIKKCLMSEQPFEVEPSKQWSDDNWKNDQQNRQLVDNSGFLVINEGEAEGKILGGCICDLSLLHGTEFMPNLDGSVLFLEDDEAANSQVFDRELQSLILQPSFSGVKGIVLGRFQKASNISNEQLIAIIKSKPQLNQIPVITNVDFGHTDPKITFPIGGNVTINSSTKSIQIS